MTPMHAGHTQQRGARAPPSSWPRSAMRCGAWVGRCTALKAYILRATGGPPSSWSRSATRCGARTAKALIDRVPP